MGSSTVKSFVAALTGALLLVALPGTRALAEGVRFTAPYEEAMFGELELDCSSHSTTVGVPLNTSQGCGAGSGPASSEAGRGSVMAHAERQNPYVGVGDTGHLAASTFEAFRLPAVYSATGAVRGIAHITITGKLFARLAAPLWTARSELELAVQCSSSSGGSCRAVENELRPNPIPNVEVSLVPGESEVNYSDRAFEIDFTAFRTGEQCPSPGPLTVWAGLEASVHLQRPPVEVEVPIPPGRPTVEASAQAEFTLDSVSFEDLPCPEESALRTAARETG